MAVPDYDEVYMRGDAGQLEVVGGLMHLRVDLAEGQASGIVEAIDRVMKGFGAEASAPVGDGGAFEVWADGGAWPGVGRFGVRVGVPGMRLTAREKRPFYIKK